MALQGLDEAFFAKLFIGGIVGFGDAIGVEGEGIACAKLAFSNFTVPILEDSQNGGSGFEALHRVIRAKQERGKMAAVGVAQASRGVVVFGKEECGERAVRSVVTEELIYRAHQALQLVQGDGALAADVGLQIGHQEGGSDPFSGDIADDESEPLPAEIEEVVIVATDFARLDANS